MHAVSILFYCLFSSVAYATETPDVSSCSCQEDTTDCSFRMKTVLLGSDICSSTSIWNVRGNNLRHLPGTFSDYYPTKNIKIDASLNELGMDPTFSLLSNFAYNSGSERLIYSTIDLSSNSLHNLNFLNGSRVSYSLEVLNISNNAITKIDEELSIWNVLKVFRIANNKISQLSNNSFSQQYSLELLDVSGNPLHTVSPSAFSSLSELETLDLSETRRLASLAEETFSALGRLRHLHLSGNKLTRLPSGLLAPLVSLQSLQLQRNALKHLPADAFRHLVNLRVLNLDSNLLDALPPQLFARLHSLQHLSARGNRLVAVPSLRLCVGPLRTALFDGNAIAAADEQAMRALWRPGFKFANLRDNPLVGDTLQWAHNASDVTVSTRGTLDALVPKKGPCSDSSTRFQSIRLTAVNYGSIETCVI